MGQIEVCGMYVLALELILLGDMRISGLLEKKHLWGFATYMCDRKDRYVSILVSKDGGRLRQMGRADRVEAISLDRECEQCTFVLK